MRRRAVLSGVAGMSAALAGCPGGNDCLAEPRITPENGDVPRRTPADAPCETVHDATFRSLGRYGESFTGPDEPGVHWRVRFDDGEFSYAQTDTGVTGSYTCGVEDCLVEIVGRPSAFEGEIIGGFDPATGLLRWDGELFRLVG